MITIYHNPNCSKSRRALEILQQNGVDYKIVEYLDHPFSREELVELLQKLHLHAWDILREKESVWQENFAGREIENSELLDILVEHQILIQRPILVKKEIAVLGRDEEKVLEIIKA